MKSYEIPSKNAIEKPRHLGDREFCVRRPRDLSTNRSAPFATGPGEEGGRLERDPG